MGYFTFQCLYVGGQYLAFIIIYCKLRNQVLKLGFPQNAVENFCCRFAIKIMNFECNQGNLV